MEKPVTFEFSSETSWLAVWEGLNDTSAKFASYAYRCITVFSEHWADEVRKECAAWGIKVKEV